MTAPTTVVRKRRWLILSHGFNMDGRAASLTVTDKMPHLLAAGIEPVVLSAVTGRRDDRFAHLQLLPWGPSGLRFDLRHLLAQRIGRGLAYRLLVLLITVVLAPFMLIERLVIGLRSQWSWALPAFVRGALLARRDGGFELVYSSGGAYSAHLAGYWLQRFMGLRWIVEVHDPLVRPDGELRTRDERMQRRLEARICERADPAWWFTDGALAAARRRNPVLGTRGLAILPGAEPAPVTGHHVPGPVCVVGHFGSLSATRSLAPALQGLAELFTRRAELRSRVRLEVYGSALDAPAAALMRELALQDVVVPIGRLEHDPQTGLSGRERVNLRMQELDALLMLHGEGWDCPEYIPSKLYDYFWARRPVLALTRDNPQLDALVAEHDGVVARSDDPAAVARAFETLLDRHQREGGLPEVRVPPVGVGQAVAQILAAVTPPRAS